LRSRRLHLRQSSISWHSSLLAVRILMSAMKVLVTIVLSVLLLFASIATADPVHVIFDTDMGNDVDDALALAMLHALESRGEAKLLAVTITKDNQWAAPFVDLVNTFYGRGDIPIGTVRNGKTPESNPMIQGPSERKRADGSFVYPHRITDGRQAPDAVALLRRVLTAQPDASVVIVQVGFSTNLARLLDSPQDELSSLTGRELVTKKVRLLSVMAGNFALPKPEFNIERDVPAATKLFNEWPTPIVASGFEIGEAMLFPATSIEHDFAYVPNHPVAEAYRLLMQMPYDRPTWDLTAVLYAVRPDRGYFSLSPPGKIAVSPNGQTRFSATANGKHQHLLLSSDQKSRFCWPASRQRRAGWQPVRISRHSSAGLNKLRHGCPLPLRVQNPAPPHHSLS
jgi:inosine-uridine nucleoside N-ribohydrolase